MPGAQARPLETCKLMGFDLAIHVAIGRQFAVQKAIAIVRCIAWVAGHSAPGQRMQNIISIVYLMWEGAGNCRVRSQCGTFVGAQHFQPPRQRAIYCIKSQKLVSNLELCAVSAPFCGHTAHTWPQHIGIILSQRAAHLASPARHLLYQMPKVGIELGASRCERATLWPRLATAYLHHLATACW